MNTATSTPAPYVPQIRLYQNWLRDQCGLSFEHYNDLWQWSVSDLEGFWQSMWDYFEMESPTPHKAAISQNVMPGAVWFEGAKTNYAHQVMRHVQPADAAGFPAVISLNEKGLRREMSWPELRRQVAALALHLQAQGLQPGDRVAAYLPNIPEAMVAFLATVSVGGVWSICAPDMGTNAVLDRFKQIEPKILIAVDGVSYGGRDFDRMTVVQELRDALPSLQHVIIHDNLGTVDIAQCDVAASTPLSVITARDDAEVQAFEPLWLPFDHPLWIVYSSGTTGLPKPIVHGHGGTVIVALANKILHNDVGCSYHPNSFGERFHWYSSTGWVMWNAQVAGLLNGVTCVIYDGNPGGSKDNPDWGILWRMASEENVTFFGAGAAFFANCHKAGLDISRCGDLSRVRALGTTGSPLSPETQSWGTEQFKNIGTDIWWCNISGGTDFAGAFVGGHRELPQEPGVMQCRMLGAAVESWNEAGLPVKGEVGELVCTQPIPSMPLFFWGDKENARYLSSYFEMYPAGHGRMPGGGDGPASMGGVWRHGDWLRIGNGNPETKGEGEGCVIFGRSDATINRHGLRMGTSELYSAVEALPEVMDSMVVDLEYLGKESYMPLFVVLRPGTAFDDALQAKLNNAIKVALSPRFIPNEIFQVAEIPRTLSGKKQELPIKKLMLGQPLEKVVNKDAMANPGCLDWYVELAKQHLAKA
ncbi:acetoacetate--CoA ligase [Limnohabitans sp. MMS-10A-160]|uniref:acetoacetate--CoA ligase n=1 Tax=unclassified Limnohabitans TaxID=2626134 RepID=UPI000D37F28F|nr:MULTISPECIES: acetoacetate--CoA ligase [unclassified Limnohabitans]PUE20536.1 acetoacetate--CoA ligase [Limnohabitans sp. MMS-10A-192]PUE25076.1 acetoacetate--CoA ligase [Limnohabitans sp. MMS-10A-160]